MAKGGSTSQQIAQLMHVLGAISFVIAIVLGLYVASRDPDQWGAAENLGVVRVLILFLAGISFFLIALNYQHARPEGKGKGESGNAGGHGQNHGGGHGYHAGQSAQGAQGNQGNQGGYTFGNQQNVYEGEVSGGQ